MVADGQHISNSERTRELSCARGATRLPVDVRSRSAFGSAGDWLGGGESAGDGQSDEAAVQSVDYDIEFHDWRDGGGGRGGLFATGLHRSGAGDAGDAGRARGFADWGAGAGAREGSRSQTWIQQRDCGDGPGDDLQRVEVRKQCGCKPNKA